MRRFSSQSARNALSDHQKGTFHIGTYDYALKAHFNAFNGREHGTECYVTTKNGITVEQKIMKQLGNYFTLRDIDLAFDSINKTNFLVINIIKNKGMSGVLLETCFLIM